MSAHSALRAPSRRAPTLAAALALAALAAGCAQMRSQGYYDPPAESSQTDAQYQAQGSAYRSAVHAPSQLQIGLDRDAPPRRDAAPAASASPTADPPTPVPPAGGTNARMTPAGEAANTAAATDPTLRAFMPQAQTYAGTFPCLTPSPQCEAQRVTVTLGPNGRWRSRTTYLASQATPPVKQTEQGCWTVTPERPARVLLLDEKGATRIELVASANNVLRVRSVLGRAPTLDYSLTRQPDLDPIDEMSAQPIPTCE